MRSWTQMIMLLIAGIAFARPALITFWLGYHPALSHPRTNIRRSPWLVAAVSFVANAVIVVLLHKLLYNRWNFLQTIREILSLAFTYQDILVFCQILVLTTVLSTGVGFFFRFLLYGSMSEGRLHGWRRIALWLLLAICLTADAGLYHLSSTGTQHLVINEVAANNDSHKFPHDRIYDYRASDYLELYNTGTLACMSDGLYLSEDPDKLDQIKLSSFRIPEKGYMIIPLDTPALSAAKEGGETFYLSNAQGKIIDQVTTRAVKLDQSWCRANDGADDWKLAGSTPGAANQQGIGWLAETPLFSHSSGFYDEPFDLQLSLSDSSDWAIYYTTDGSTPTVDSILYTGPIHVYDKSPEPNLYRNIKNVTKEWMDTPPEEVSPVDKAFVVRAVAADKEGNVSDVVNATYFVNLGKYKNSRVLSIIVNPQDLWGEDGIYITGSEYDDWFLSDRTEREPFTHFNQKGKDYEVEADLTLFSGEKQHAQKAGLRIAGASTRNLPVKRFNLYARNKYSGNSVFDIPLFEGVSTHKLSLRPGNGNALIQAMAADRAVTTQKSIPAFVFVNGEFWYHTYLSEGYGEQYFEEYYQLNPQNILAPSRANNLFNTDLNITLKEELYSFLAQSDMRREEDYKALCEKIDMQSYIDFMCIQLYCDNYDFNESKNTVWWRSIRKGNTPYEDTRWRFGLYDLDAVEWVNAETYGVQTKAQKNSFVLEPPFFVGSVQEQQLYASVKVNPHFQKQFTLTMMDLMNANFRYETATAFIDTFSADNTLMTEETQQFFKDFFRERPPYMQRFLAEEFCLSGTVESITLSTNEAQAGFIRINTIAPDLSDGEWEGQYFTDFPVEITAVPAEGYVFDKWEGDLQSTEEALCVYLPEGGMKLHASFRKEE